ncbi:spore coat protein U domain-containing protein [Qipengyuania sp. MTN3-11]|uniref:spore coat protein U domain-containing protein n=1 Tax=Qipengyuania sp. MTN3-11 TaxID=3056557 RepID=UPI0036F2DC15
MKLAYALAGVAAVALSATAASAQTIVSNSGAGSTLTSQTTGTASQGTAGDSAGATFNLSATVAEDCSFYTGGGDVNVDFGTLGIYNTSTQGLDNAFEMTGPALVTIVTSVAGCNTANRLEIDKGGNAQGMSTDNTSGFDTNTFQNNLPYSVEALYQATSDTTTQGPGSERRSFVAQGQGQDAKQQGAFKSEMTINFRIPVAEKALVAGEYTDTVELTLTAI